MLSASEVPSVLYARRCKFFRSGFQGRHRLRWNTRGAEGDCLRGHIKPSYVRPPWPFVCFTWKCRCFGFHCWRFPGKVLSCRLQTPKKPDIAPTWKITFTCQGACGASVSLTSLVLPHHPHTSRSVTQLSLPLHHSVSLRHHKYSLIHTHTVLISCSLSFCPHVTPQLCLPNHHDLLLSPTYRWWAHLCGCLSHLTTCLRSRGGGGTAERGLEPKKKKEKTHWNKAQRRRWWCHHRAGLSTTCRDDNNLHPPTNPWWLIPVFHRENGQSLWCLSLDVEVWCIVRKCRRLRMSVKKTKLVEAHYRSELGDSKNNSGTAWNK